jgi:alanyl-tRNA synthetase
MTEKLFWKDPYQTDFTADVVEQFKAEDGNAVVLDRTCFYATSGGQPNDTGTLDSASVKDVRIDDGKLLHITDKPLDSKNVSGKINWSHRFDHMQQHTGQHIISAAFFRLFQAETSSFHLGDLLCSIELNKTNLGQAQVTEAEDLANHVIQSAVGIEAFFVDPEKAHEYPLRKRSDLSESLRIIRIGDFDLSPCSGTHVRNSGEIGSVFIHSFEKLSKSTKVTFLCGNRVRTLYHQELSFLKDASKKLTTSFDLIPESIVRMQSQIKELRRENMQLKETRLKSEASELAADSQHWKDCKLVIRVWPRPFEEVRFIAQRLSEQESLIGVLVSASERRCAFFKHPNVSIDLKPLFSQFLENTGGRGGGPPHFMEAGNLNVTKDPEAELRHLFS